MFKKKPTIKPLAPLRSSERRKTADQIIKLYNIPVPQAPTAAPEDDGDAATRDSAPSLASIRNALLPENTQSARFTTTTGPDLQLVHGTIYVGTHAEGDERILWFRLEQGPGTDGRIYPTVYSLWKNPGIIPLLHTQSPVMPKLYGGADLMIPGLANGPPFPEAAVKNSIVAVADIEKPSVPTFVGVCEIDVSQLGRVQGMKGHAVRGVQWFGDELWTWSSAGKPCPEQPEEIAGWNSIPESLDKAVEDLSLGDGGEAAAQADESAPVEEEPEEDTSVPMEPEKEPTTKEIDDAFFKAFLYALHSQKDKNPSQQNHGLSFPLQQSFVLSNLVTPFLPIYTPQQSQFYQIKKTSWKNVKKFVKYLDKEQLVKSKDRGGETIVMDVDFNDQRVVTFEPYRLPRKSGSEGKAPSKATESAASGEAFEVKTLYRPGVKLIPDLFPPLANTNPNNYYSSSEVSRRLADYLSAQDPPIISPSNPRIISLNPFISNKIFSSSSTSDLAILSRGTVPRDTLLKRLLEDASLCAPYHAILKPGRTLKDVKPKPGALPKISVIIERRTGSKVATRIIGLETFGVSPQLLGEELQKKCASSTSVSQAVGAAKGIMEVLVQGDHRKTVEKSLGMKGVKAQWIEVVDKTQKKGGR